MAMALPLDFDPSFRFCHWVPWSAGKFHVRWEKPFTSLPMSGFPGTKYLNRLRLAAGVKPNIVHVPSEVISVSTRNGEPVCLGDKAHCGIFDNTKIKKSVPDFQATIPFSKGAEEIISWYKQIPSTR